LTTVSLIALVGLGMMLTGVTYLVSLAARKHYPSPWTTPVLFSTTIIIAVLLLTGLSFEAYRPAKDVLILLLGPATVALAIPLYKNRQIVSGNLVPMLWGLLAGSLGTMIAAGVMARAFGLSADLIASITLKSATVPIAVEIAPLVQGVPALTAIFVVITGMLGAAFGPWLMDCLRVADPLSRGLALGTISHGQGTAQAATESEFSGAVAGVAMGLGAICTATAAPWLVPFILG
jgi:predicted murein hydrolase (TIGR00659 family)